MGLFYSGCAPGRVATANGPWLRDGTRLKAFEMCFLDASDHPVLQMNRDASQQLPQLCETNRTDPFMGASPLYHLFVFTPLQWKHILF